MGEIGEGKKGHECGLSLWYLSPHEGEEGWGEHHVKSSSSRVNEDSVWEGSQNGGKCERLQDSNKKEGWDLGYCGENVDDGAVEEQEEAEWWAEEDKVSMEE